MKLPKDSPTFCALPWVHMTIRPNGAVKPCCRFEGEIKVSDQAPSYAETFQGPEFQRIRQQMSEGQEVEGCRRCYTEEKAAGSSMRTSHNEKFTPMAEETPQVKYLEFAFSNLCNLSCRSCNSFFSTKWIKDEVHLFVPANNQQLQLVRNPLSQFVGTEKSLRMLKLIGGEPLLDPNHEKLLELLDQNAEVSNISFNYATNATTRVSEKVLDVWHRSKFLEITFSVDGLKDKNDFFRHGSKWKEVIENIRWFIDNINMPSRKMFYIHTVINIYNVHELIEIDEWLKKEFPENFVSLVKDCLVNPKWLAINNLPESEKLKLIERYEAFIETLPENSAQLRWYRYVCHYLRMPSTADFNEFISMDTKLNELRGQDSGSHADLKRIRDNFTHA